MARKAATRGVSSGMFQGGIHWYAQAWWYNAKDGTIAHAEAEHELTGAEAAALNEYYGAGPADSWRFKAGERSPKFWKRSDAIKAAEALLRERFGQDVEIARGSVWRYWPEASPGGDWDAESVT